MRPGAARLKAVFGIGAGWAPYDAHRALTRAAAAGLGLGVLLALFGLPPVDIHGPLHRLGVMDPACGMTRGVRLVLRGSLADAVRYNPASPLVVLGALVVVIRHAAGVGTGRWLTVTVHPRPAAIALGLMLVGLLWANQQHHAALLLR